jgi:hypothetical protein
LRERGSGGFRREEVASWSWLRFGVCGVGGTGLSAEE